MDRTFLPAVTGTILRHQGDVMRFTIAPQRRHVDADARRGSLFLDDARSPRGAGPNGPAGARIERMI